MLGGKRLRVAEVGDQSLHIRRKEIRILGHVIGESTPMVGPGKEYYLQSQRNFYRSVSKSPETRVHHTNQYLSYPCSNEQNQVAPRFTLSALTHRSIMKSKWQ